MTRNLTWFFISLLIIVCAPFEWIYGQDTIPDRSMPEIKFSGYIKSDFFTDSRQNFTVRENMLLLYPKPRIDDAAGSDINDVRSTQFIPFQSRITARFTGTRILNARASGLMEGEFFGNSDLSHNTFRLRHASIVLDWENGLSIMTGQFWHPLFVTECYPTTASMNTGIPFNPFARNPQFEIAYKTTNVRYSAAIVSQLDFKSTGPGGGSAGYLRNSGLPELVSKIIYVSDNKEFLIGTAAAIKQLRPRLTDAGGNKVDETVSSYAAMGFSKYTRGMTTFKLAGILGQDMFHLTMLGGYAVSSEMNYTEGNLFDQQLQYSPVNTFSAWGEFIYGKIWEMGLFAGYSSNLGAAGNISIADQGYFFYSRGSDINHLWRVSPRLSYQVKNMRIGTEGEYTVASYAQSLDSHGRPQGNDAVGNFRLLLFAFYHF
jgi:hypothetical protein